MMPEKKAKTTTPKEKAKGKAKEHFYKGSYSLAKNCFAKENDFYGAGLCSLLLNELDEAKAFWQKNSQTSPASSFGLIILNILKGDYSKKPSFFQTRAFLEIYLNLFLINNKLDWAEIIIKSHDFLFGANPETYKFIGRALFSNGYFNLAVKFCKTSLGYFPCDPEALIILSQCSFLLANLEDALGYLDKISALTNSYYPEKLFRKIVLEKINKNKN